MINVEKSKHNPRAIRLTYSDPRWTAPTTTVFVGLDDPHGLAFRAVRGVWDSTGKGRTPTPETVLRITRELQDEIDRCFQEAT